MRCSILKTRTLTRTRLTSWGPRWVQPNNTEAVLYAKKISITVVRMERYGLFSQADSVTQCLGTDLPIWWPRLLSHYHWMKRSRLQGHRIVTLLAAPLVHFLERLPPLPCTVRSVVILCTWNASRCTRLRSSNDICSNRREIMPRTSIATSSYVRCASPWGTLV